MFRVLGIYNFDLWSNVSLLTRTALIKTDPAYYIEDCRIYFIDFLHTQSQENLVMYETSNTTTLTI